MDNVLVLGIIIAHFAVVLAIGWYSYRASLSTPEDYFMGSRTLGAVVLIISVYATNMTAFYIIGIPGIAYHKGIGVYGFVAFGTALVTPALYYIIGYRAWLLGKHKGYMTPPELYGKRWGSDAVSVVFFFFLLIFTMPYCCVSLIGGGVAITMMTKGAVSYGTAVACIISVVVIYVLIGGMRGTAWVNVYQGLFFMVVGVVVFFLLGAKLGGISEMTGKVLAEKPALLVREGNFTPKQWLSYLFISPLSVIVFPHVFMKLLTGRTAGGLKKLVVSYPFIVLVTWPPVIFIGIWGACVHPGLAGKASDAILPWMVSAYLPVALSGVVLAGILAALMSSIDAMLLSLSTMLTRDVLGRYAPGVIRGREVAAGRMFMLLLSLLVAAIAMVRPSSVFAIATFAFNGYVIAIPMMIGALVWRGATKYGALASLVVPALLLPVYQFTDILSWSTFGFSCNIPLLALSVFLFIAVSFLTSHGSDPDSEGFFEILNGVFRKTKVVERNK